MLHYERLDAVERALASVVDQSYPIEEIVVVDNASPSVDRLRAICGKLPGVRLVERSTNDGFTGGMNAALAAVSADVELVYASLDDIVLAPDCIEKLVRFAESRPDAGLVGPLLMNEDGTIRIGGGYFELASKIARVPIGAREEDRGQYGSPFEVDWLGGGMALVRMSALRSAGAFRDDFWFGWEDIELSLRYRATGHRIFVCPSARATHLDTPRRPSAIGRRMRTSGRKNFVALYILYAPLHRALMVWMRYGLLFGLAGGLRDGSLLRDIARANGWLLRHAFRLRREGAAHRARAQASALVSVRPRRAGP